jgi:hypothetical protein
MRFLLFGVLVRILTSAMGVLSLSWRAYIPRRFQRDLDRR